jgi:membrane protease YdiL (CAAX protease family)
VGAAGAGTLSLLLLGVIVPLLAGGDVSSLESFSRYLGIASIGPLDVAGVALVVHGVGEETGWRGFAADRLLRTHTLPRTALVVAAVWGGRHLSFLRMVAGFRGMGPLRSAGP